MAAILPRSINLGHARRDIYEDDRMSVPRRDHRSVPARPYSRRCRLSDRVLLAGIFPPGRSRTTSLSGGGWVYQPDIPFEIIHLLYGKAACRNLKFIQVVRDIGKKASNDLGEKRICRKDTCLSASKVV